ncbi:MAG: hypothetical protein Q4F30_06355 [Akkermansia sp.]|nr:hypothetical protein [Akkermansia sp.]
MRAPRIDLGCNSVCFSVNPWRQSFLRRLFAERGIKPPRFVQGRRVKPTRPGEPAAYSGLALDFIEALLEADRRAQPFLLIYEDDAFPCADPQGELERLLAAHPLPADCGILALGDINGVSRVRGRQTLLLPDCAPVYTRLEPGVAENKGSHALLIFRRAFIPYAQAIIENGVTDCATSRICRYADISAYGLFRHPLFTQHKFPDGGHRLPELFAYNGRAGLEEMFPNPTALTRVLLPDEPRRFWVLSNAPGKDLNRLALAEGEALVFLNRAVDWPQAQGLPLRKIALCRRNARSQGEWFLPKAGGLEGFDDMLLLTDRVVEAEHAWMKDYRHATGYHPTTGWIAYRLLREQFPAARITLVDFLPDGDIGTYKWPRHAWGWEAEFYRKHGVEVVSALGIYN